MDLEERIAQFRNMAEADPENEMAHFSLGNTLLQAGRPEEAAESFARAIALNPNMSKAYQLAGESHRQAGARDEAVRILTDGFKVAAERGDVLPRNEIQALLEALDAPVPEVATESETIAAPEGAFVCQVTGRPGTPLEKPPFRGELGKKIQEYVAKETWNEWIMQGTKVINELRLDLSREDHARVYDQHMLEFLGLEGWAREHGIE